MKLNPITFFVGKNETGKSQKAKELGYTELVYDLYTICEPSNAFEGRYAWRAETFKVVNLIRAIEGCSSNRIWINQPERGLYPGAQTFLCDILYDLHESTGKEFIVETHSEYIVRRSQIYVRDIYKRDGSIAANPFMVIKFSKHDDPEVFHYLENGRFKESFDSGFYDESSTLAYCIL